MSQSETSESNSGSDSALINEQIERHNLMEEFFKWKDKSEDATDEVLEKCEQRDKVDSTLMELSKMLKKKERELQYRKQTFVEMTDGQRMEIAEIRDDIKMMEKVMRVKQLEMVHLDQEANVLRKTWKDVCHHLNKLEKELKSIYETPKESEKNADKNAK